MFTWRNSRLENKSEFDSEFGVASVEDWSTFFEVVFVFSTFLDSDEAISSSSMTEEQTTSTQQSSSGSTLRSSHKGSSERKPSTKKMVFFMTCYRKIT